MDIQITNIDRTDAGTTVNFQGRYPVRIHHGRKYGNVEVLVENASHKARRRSGRTFWSWDEAKAGYKSSEMQAMLAEAEEISNQ